MTLAEAVTTWLAEQAGLAVGTDLFVSRFAEDASLATRVRETGGPGRGYSPLATATFQLTTRGQGYASTRQRAELLYGVIYPADADGVPVRNLTAGGWHILAIDAIQPPADLGLTEGGLDQVVFNIQVRAGRLAEEE
jgi:hypothetical protein